MRVRLCLRLYRGRLCVERFLCQHILSQHYIVNVSKMSWDHAHAWECDERLSAVELEKLCSQASQGCRYCQVLVDVAKIYQSRWKRKPESEQPRVLFRFKHSMIEDASMP